ncbi:MAG: DEAD/DEAH box helicase [Patescibacteria group bacterium]
MSDLPPQSTGEKTGFSGLGITEKILGILGKMKFDQPTLIQHKAIPIALEGNDVIGIAQTGTGKTLAFTVPIVQHLAGKEGGALVILPTRELALQVDETFQKIARSFGIYSAVLIGGSPMGAQIRAVRGGARVIIGTPGRIIDHLKQKTMTLRNVKLLVLDEADRMFDMGFAPQIKEILKAVPKERQTMLFSATMPDDIVQIATVHMHSPVRVEIARSGSTSERVEQELFIVKANQKNRLLEALLIQYTGSVLVFSRTKHGAKRICRLINHIGIKAAEIHSNRSLSQRREALQGFKDGRYRVLVATDIAARGIDVKDITLVINFDVPEQAEDYIHRIGRTARAGSAGRAITFTTPDQHYHIRNIERLMKAAIKISKLPELPPDRAPLPRDEEDRDQERPRYNLSSQGGYGSRQPRRPSQGGHGGSRFGGGSRGGQRRRR